MQNFDDQIAVASKELRNLIGTGDDLHFRAFYVKRIHYEVTDWLKNPDGTFVLDEKGKRIKEESIIKAGWANGASLGAVRFLERNLLVGKKRKEGTFAHELGHSLGLGHKFGISQNIMSYSRSRRGITLKQCRQAYYRASESAF